MQVPFSHPQTLAPPLQYNCLYAMPDKLKKLQMRNTPEGRLDARVEYEKSVRPVIAEQLELEMDLASRGERRVLTHSQKVLLGYDSYVADEFFSRGRLHASTLEDILREKAQNLE